MSDLPPPEEVTYGAITYDRALKQPILTKDTRHMYSLLVKERYTFWHDFSTKSTKTPQSQQKLDYLQGHGKSVDSRNQDRTLTVN